MAATSEALTNVRQRVRGVIAFFAGKADSTLKDADDLRDDCGLGEIHLRALAKPFTHISADHDGKSVTQPEVVACDTIKDCVTLVSGKLS